MKRRLLNILLALSLLSSLCFTTLWVRSRFAGDVLEWRDSRVYHKMAVIHRPWRLYSNAGRLTFSVENQMNALSPNFPSGISPDRPVYDFQYRTIPAHSFPVIEDPFATVGFQFLGAGFRAIGDGTGGSGGRLLSGSRSVACSFFVPYWLLVMFAAILPALSLRRHYRNWRKRQRAVGLCATCGYDLRASKDRCPECGTAIPVRTASSGKA